MAIKSKIMPAVGREKWEVCEVLTVRCDWQLPTGNLYLPDAQTNAALYALGLMLIAAN